MTNAMKSMSLDEIKTRNSKPEEAAFGRILYELDKVTSRKKHGYRIAPFG